MWVSGQWLVTNQVDDQWSLIKGIYQNKDYCKRVSPPPGFIKKNQEKLGTEIKENRDGCKHRI